MPDTAFKPTGIFGLEEEPEFKPVGIFGSEEPEEFTPTGIFGVEPEEKKPPAWMKLAGKAVAPFVGAYSALKSGLVSKTLSGAAESIKPSTGAVGEIRIGPRALAQQLYAPPPPIPGRKRTAEEIIAASRRTEPAEGILANIGALGENIGKGMIRTPLYIAAWKSDLIARPAVAVKDMAAFIKEGVHTWQDVWKIIEGDEEAKAHMKKQLQEYPVETAFAMFGPLAFLLGIRRGGKALSRKIERGGKAPAAEIVPDIAKLPEDVKITKEQRVLDISREEAPGAKEIPVHKEKLPEKPSERTGERGEEARGDDIQRKPEGEREAGQRPPQKEKPTKVKTPEEVAAELDLIYEGKQEGVSESGIPPKYMFEDKQTGSHMANADLSKMPEQIAKRRQEFKEGEKAKAERLAKKPAKPTEKAAEGVWQMEVKKAVIEPDRFQLSREDVFAEKTAASIAAAEKKTPGVTKEPITVWKDPTDGKYYVLDGFSRTEGFKRAGRDRANYQEFKGTEAEAIEYAITHNKQATAPGFMGDLKSFKAAKKEKMPEKKLREVYEGDVSFLNQAINLNPKGKFVQAYADKALRAGAPHIKRFAAWVGELRKKFPDKLTNRHEDQIFDFLYMKDKGQAMGKYVNKDPFMQLIENQIDRFDFKPTDPLILKRGEAPVVGAAAMPDTKALAARIVELKAREGVAKTLVEKEALREDIARREADIKFVQKKQTDFFETITPEEYLASGPRLFRSLGEELSIGLKKGKPKVDVEKGPFKPGVGKYVRTPSNYMGAIPGQKPKDVTGARIIRRILNLEREARIEEGLGVERLNKEFFDKMDKKDAPRQLGKKLGSRDWSKIVEAIEQTPLELQARTDLSAGTKTAIRNLKSWYEDNRKILVEDLRSEYRRFLSEEQVKKVVPDDWGVNEYLTHIFPGDYLIKFRVGKKLQTVGSAHTKAEAMRVIAEDFQTRSEVKPANAADYVVTRKKVIEIDPFRMTDQRKARFIDGITKASELTREEVTAFLEGKKYKAKTVFDPLKPRKGAAGYSVDIPFILETYNSFMARRRMGSRMRKKVVPLIDVLERTGREDLANYMRDNVSHVMGKQHPWSVAVDNTLAQLPWIKNHIRSHLLDRWSAKIKLGQRFLLLTASLKFHGLNRLQTFQTLLPILDVKNTTFWKGQMKLSADQRALLDKHNVRFVTGGKLEEAGKPAMGAKFREKASRKSAGIAAAETFNQELAWTTMYEHGRKIGLSDKQAADYAFARGNIYTQFAHFKGDVPKMFRNPVITTLMPFRRFPIKTYELLWDMMKEGKASGLTKFGIAHLLVGGTRSVTGLLAKVGTVAYLGSKVFGVDKSQHVKSPTQLEKEAYEEVSKALGETGANAVFWGLPGLVDLDLSYSIQLIDRDYGGGAAEEITNEFLGPMFTVGVAVGKAVASEKGTVSSPVERGARAVAHRVSGLRWTLALEKILSGDYDFKNADGTKRFKGDLMDVIIEGMGGRPVEAGKLDLYVGAMAEMKQQWDGYADDAVAKFLKDDLDSFYKKIDDWNQLYPEAPMTAKMLVPRIKRRLKDADKYLEGRMYKQLPKGLKYFFYEDHVLKGEEED